MIPSIVGRELEERFQSLLKTQFRVREDGGLVLTIIFYTGKPWWYTPNLAFPICLTKWYNFPPKNASLSLATHHDTPPVTPPVDEKQKRLLQALKNLELGTAELLKALHIRDRNYFREGYIRPTLRSGFIEQTKPEVKHSKLQKYRLTDKGRAALSANEHK